MQLYVDLCAAAPFLSGILTSNPGMLDELMDSLVLDKLPTLESLEQELRDLTFAAEDLDPILHSFKNSQQLRVGVRDLLGKEDIQATTAALSDIALACLRRITAARIRKAGGEARRADDRGRRQRGPEVCELVVVAMGKFGGREMNYHSDVDLIFLYEAEGGTFHNRRSRRSGETTTNQHFFSELGQRIIKVANQLGPHGRLFEIDPRLASDRAKRGAGHVVRRVPPLFRIGPGAAMGAAGALQGPRDLRLVRGLPQGARGDRPRGI